MNETSPLSSTKVAMTLRKVITSYGSYYWGLMFLSHLVENGWLMLQKDVELRNVRCKTAMETTVPPHRERQSKVPFKM